jgi:hypothetical protein
MKLPPPRDYNLICRHYQTILHNRDCAAGIAYGDLQAEIDGKPEDVRLVCMGRRPGCAKYQPRTALEIAADDRTEADGKTNIATARAAIVAKSQGKFNVWGEIDPCPVCATGTLKYSVSMWKGHIQGKCTTPNCVNFNENKA